MPKESEETTVGPTPNGGIKAAAYWQDSSGRPCPKQEAVRAEIVEYAKDGTVVARTYGTLHGGPLTNTFDPSQPRDEHGRWSGGAESLSADLKRRYEQLYPASGRPSLKGKALQLAKEQYRSDYDHLLEMEVLAKKGPATQPAAVIKQPLRPSVPADPAKPILPQHLEALAASVKKHGGEYNFAHLGDVREAHPDWSKQQFDRVIGEARQRGLVTLTPAEGRHGVNERDRRSMLHEPNPLRPDEPYQYLYVSLR